jgi:hypothetical protein
MNASPPHGGMSPQEFPLAAIPLDAPMSEEDNPVSGGIFGPRPARASALQPMPTSRYVTPYKICLLALVDMWCIHGEDYGADASDALLEVIKTCLADRQRTFTEPPFSEIRRRVQLLADEHGDLMVQHLDEKLEIVELNDLFAFFDCGLSTNRCLLDSLKNSFPFFQSDRISPWAGRHDVHC